MDKSSYEIRIRHWIDVIHEANASGMTKRSWCELSGISIKQFYYWQKKVRDYTSAHPSHPSTMNQHGTPLSPAMKQKNLPIFCELPIRTGQKRLSTFVPELVLQGECFQLLIGNAVTEKTLSTVLSVLSHV